MELETPRKKLNATKFAREYYDFLKEIEIDGVKKKKYICKLCNTEIDGTKESNLVPHIKKKHTSIFQEFEKNKSLVIQRLELLQYFVEIVSVNGRSFEHLLDSGFEGVASYQLLTNYISLKENHCEVVKVHLSEIAKK